MSLRYARFVSVSTREQARSDKFSIPNQLERTQTEAQARGWIESAGPFVVTGQSRTRYIQLDQASAQIEPLRLMLQSARNGEFDVLVMTEFDRLRELLDQVFRTLASYRVQLFSLAQPIDPMPAPQYNIYKADTVAMLIGLSQMTSRIEISRTRRKWSENMPKRITELGLPVQIPYGYRKPPGHEHDRRAVPEPDPLIAPHIVRIKDMLLSGLSTSQLIDYLDQNGLTPPRSEKWHPQTVRDILRNQFYAGIVRFGASRVITDPKTASPKRDRSIPDDLVTQNTGRHIPLWDAPTRELILLEIKRRTRNYRGRSNNQFTGLVKCGICGSNLWRQGNGPREYRLIWRCSNNSPIKGGVCHNALPHAILLDKIAAALEDSLPIRAAKKTAAPVTNEGTLKSLRAQLERLETAYLAGHWDLERYAVRKKQLDESIRDCLKETERARRQQAERAAWLKSLTEMQNTQDLPHWLKTAPPVEVNRALHILLDSIVVGEGIELRFK